jgi:hypothetical protein
MRIALRSLAGSGLEKKECGSEPLTQTSLGKNMKEDKKGKMGKKKNEIKNRVKKCKRTKLKASRGVRNNY